MKTLDADRAARVKRNLDALDAGFGSMLSLVRAVTASMLQHRDAPEPTAEPGQLKRELEALERDLEARRQTLEAREGALAAKEKELAAGHGSAQARPASPVPDAAGVPARFVEELAGVVAANLGPAARATAFAAGRAVGKSFGSGAKAPDLAAALPLVRERLEAAGCPWQLTHEANTVSFTGCASTELLRAAAADPSGPVAFLVAGTVCGVLEAFTGQRFRLELEAAGPDQLRGSVKTLA